MTDKLLKANVIVKHFKDERNLHYIKRWALSYKPKNFIKMFFSYYKYKSNLEQYQIALSIKLSKVGGCKNITLLKILKNENCPWQTTLLKLTRTLQIYRRSRN